MQLGSKYAFEYDDKAEAFTTNNLLKLILSEINKRERRLSIIFLQS